MLHGYGFDDTFQGLHLPQISLAIAGHTIDLPRLQYPPVTSLATVLLKNHPHSTTGKHPEVLFQDALSKELRGSVHSSVETILRDTAVYGTNSCNTWDYFIVHSLAKDRTFLNVLCVRAHMDERTVIMDNDLLDIYLDMSPELRYRQKVYRKALKRQDPDLAAIPNANTGLSVNAPGLLVWMFTLGKRALRKYHLLPPSHVPHPAFTEGAWPNMAELIRSHEKLKRLIWETVHDPECIDPHLFKVKAIDSILERHLKRSGQFDDILFLVLTFGRWHKKYGP